MKKILQKLLSAALAVCILVSTMPVTTAAAAELPAIGDKFTVNGIQYQITKAATETKEGIAEVISNSEVTYSGILEIPSEVTDSDVSYYVKSIGTAAFKGCTGLTHVLLPTGMGIGTSAFEGCTGLTSIDLSNVKAIGNAAFRGCTGLTCVSLNEYEVSIGESAFEDCTGVTKVSLYNGMDVQKSAFKGCTGLKDLKIVSGVTVIAESAFEGCTALAGVTIPDSMNSISDYAFKDCTALKSVIFNSEVPGSFQSNIFSGCTKLEKIYVPDRSSYETVLTEDLDKLDSVVFVSEYDGKPIKYRVFGDSQVEVVENNYNLNSIEIPETVDYGGKTYSVTGIGDYAFYYLPALTSVTLPASIVSIGEGAFQDSAGLTQVTMPDSLTKIGIYAFYGCSALTGVMLPDSLTSIENDAFGNCDELSSVNIPSGVTEIGSRAFEGCDSLTDVSFAQNSKLSTIGNAAFSYSALNGITIPGCTVSIEGDVFYNCTQLTDLTFEAGSGLQSIGDYAFSNTSLSEISIPSGVSVINKNLFYNCQELQSVSLKDDYDLELLGERAFSSCTQLESVSFPENSKLTSISEDAFYQDAALTHITVPSGVTSIGEQAFMMTGLSDVSISSNVKWIGSMAFACCTNLPAIAVDPENTDYCSADGVLYNKDKTELVTYPAGKTDAEYTVPAEIVSIDMAAFAAAPSLTKVTVPSGVTQIKMGSFYMCPALKTVVFESSAPPEFEQMIFAGDTAMEHVYVPASALTAYQSCAANLSVNQRIIEGVAGVGNQFTADGLKYEIISMSPNKVKVVANDSPCTYSGNITIPEAVTDADSQEYAVTEIGQEAFLDCSGLTGISMPDSITAIDAWAFENCSKLTDVSIPDNVTQIGKYAFKGCKKLTEIKLPENLSSLGVCSFMNCTALQDVTIPEKTDEITQQAFDGCTGLKTVSIGNGVATIGDMAFMGCTGLTDITIPAGVDSIGQSAFMGAGLTGITFKGNVGSIEDGAFYFAFQLAKISFEGAVPPKTVGKDLFEGDTYPICAVVPAGTMTAYGTAFSAYTECSPVQLKFEEKAGLSAPSGLTWDGTAAKWDRVTGATGYTVTLYLDGKTVTSQNVSPDTLSFDFKNEIKGDGGSYTFKVIAKGNDSVSDSAESAASGKYQEKTNLSVPSGLTWDGTAAKWDRVTGATGYTVTLYVDGKTVTSQNVSPDTLSFDFKDEIKDGGGSYTFKVIAKGSDSVYDSAESASSGEYQEKVSETGIISSFDPLTSYNKTVSYGTAYDQIGLPTVIKAVVDNLSNQLVSVIKWVSGVAFDGNKSGTYDFTPVLDSGYRIKDSGVKLPHITVTVSAKQESHSDSSSEEKKPEQTPKTEVKVDPTDNTSTVTAVTDSINIAGDTSQISVTVPVVTTDTTGTNAVLDTGKKAKVEINLPSDAIVQQLAAKKDVDLTLAVPSSVAKNTGANTSVDIKVNSDIFAAAKANESDVTIKIKDMDSQELAYSWTFKGADLAKSAAPVTDVNISMAVRLTTEVSQVNRVTPNNVGLVLMFDHSGTLPSTANVTFSAKEKGFQPGQTLFFYFYNPVAGQIEPQGKQYTVDADGNLTVQISHCSNYVLLPHSARTITLDTRSYVMPVGNSYETGVKLYRRIRAKNQGLFVFKRRCSRNCFEERQREGNWYEAGANLYHDRCVRQQK